MIELVEIRKVFHNHNNKAVEALKEINFSVEKGSFTSVIGPSGCGKTTLLKIVGAIINPSGGYVTIDGGNPSQALLKHYFGFVFQEPALLPWRSVLRNIQLPAEILHEKKAKARADSLIRLVGLAGFEGALPKELSSGMKTRVAIARALSFHPPVLLMDEPFGNLDEITRDMMNSELLRIWREIQATVIFVTHSIREAVLLSDNVVVLTSRPGKIKEIIHIDLPRPRTREMRRLPEFGAMVEDIRELLTF